MLDFKYDAFISYRRSDGSKVAHWLRQHIENFRPPKSLKQKYGRKLKLYLDTAYERGTSDFYINSIKPALLASHYLIVIATPDARERREGVEDWIKREVKDFSQGPNGKNIVVVRGAGEFNDPLPAKLEQQFPNIEIVDLRGAGRFWYLNPFDAARLSSEKLKLVAPLLNVSHEEMPFLRQEEHKRQQFRLGATLGVIFGVLTAISGLSVYALNSRNQAVRALEDSMFATGSMVLQSAGISENGEDRQTRRLLINQGCDLIDKLSSSSGIAPKINERIKCIFERAKSREILNEHKSVKSLHAQANQLVGELYSKTQRALHGELLLTVKQRFIDYLQRIKSDDEAKKQLFKSAEQAKKLMNDHPKRSSFQRFYADAHTQLGDINRNEKKPLQALVHYEEATNAMTKTLEEDFPSSNSGNVTLLIRLHKNIAVLKQRLNDIDGAVKSFLESANAINFLNKKIDEPKILQEAAVSLAYQFDLELKRDNEKSASKIKDKIFSLIEKIIRSKKSTEQEKQKALGLKAWINKQTDLKSEEAQP